MTKDLGRVDYYEKDGKWIVFGRICGVIATYNSEKEAMKRMIEEIQNKITPESTMKMRRAFSYGEGQNATQVHSGYYRSGG